MRILIHLFFIITLALLFQSCSDTTAIHVSSLPDSESKIIVEIMRAMIESKTDLKVRVTHHEDTNSESTHGEMFQALQSAAFDIYPDSIATVYQTIQQKDEVFDANDSYALTRKELLEKFNIIPFQLFTFLSNDESQIRTTNYDVVLVRKEILDQHPVLIFVLSLLFEIVSEEDLNRLISFVEEDLQDPEKVAKTFLEENGLL